MLALDRLAEWKTYERAIWTSVRATENLRFYDRSQDGQKYMTAGLAGERRFWVAGLVPRDEVKIAIVPGDHVPGAADAGTKKRRRVQPKAPETGAGGPEAQL